MLASDLLKEGAVTAAAQLPGNCQAQVDPIARKACL
jgi:hypothetical protein